MRPFITLTSAVVPLPYENVDTDQIIPARFLKVTDKNGLGEALFADWRYHPDGRVKADFILNQPRFQQRQVLLAGDNFGCGSSREHAPWALTAYGFRAVISTSFADIFRNNSLKNGLLPIAIDPDAHAHLFTLLEEDPEATVTVELAEQCLHLPDGQVVDFPIDPFSKRCLLRGIDQLGYLQEHTGAVRAFETARPVWM